MCPLQRIDERTTRGTWISFHNLGRVKGRVTNTYQVLADNGSLLAEIRWYGPFRKYSLFPLPKTVYEEKCLLEIVQFCREETQAHLARRRAEAI